MTLSLIYILFLEKNQIISFVIENIASLKLKNNFKKLYKKNLYLLSIYSKGDVYVLFYFIPAEIYLVKPNSSWMNLIYGL
jgi:hypothetical protein